MFYPDHARYAKLAAAELGVEFVDLNDGNGYLFALVGPSGMFLSGAGTVCSYPINNASSLTIARDKAHTKKVLSHFGIPVIPGCHFFLSDDYAKLRNAGHEAGDAHAYAASLGFPLFCKPLAGGRGNFAEVVRDAAELDAYIARVRRHFDAILIEPFIRGDEYRVVIHDGMPIYTTSKRQAAVHGDGVHSVAALLEELNRRLQGTGISPYTPASIAFTGFQETDVPPAGTVIPLAGRRNLSALGEVESLDTSVPPELARVATASCAALGLRLGAIDLFDVSERRDRSELLVIEVNGNPTLSSLERAGRLDLILRLWVSMIRESLEL